MTTTRHRDFPELKAIAGGKENWRHNPDYCEILSVELKRLSVEIKLSAGGYERGIAILLRVPLTFLEKVMPQLLENQNYIDAVSVETLGLNKRLVQILQSNSINTIKDIRLMSERKLLSIKGFGRSSLSELLESLKQYDIEIQRK